VKEVENAEHVARMGKEECIHGFDGKVRMNDIARKI
jgi:hypothetical protein